ncbi:MAG: hypothetical protein IKM92_00270, partial [Bacteroidaceae bacterium]|nr:hypothetical protein [Bacteroidaceae bacterium]
NTGDIPSTISSFITSSLSETTVTIDKSKLIYGFKYKIGINIYRENNGQKTNIERYFILIMNDIPLIGDIKLIPSKGYTSTLFLFTCNECTDDYTKKNNLFYKFTYTTKADYISVNMTTNGNEKIIQDWSLKNEVLKKFNTSRYFNSATSLS